jgi:hypothetical protein
MLSNLSKLEAINTMLSVIGESPVNTLVGAVSADTQIALNVLDEVNRDIQAKGWHFNTEFDVVLTPDVNTKFISFPSGYLRVDLEAHNAGDLDVVVRGTKLYDRKEHTFEFDDEVKATVVYGLDFEDLPHSAKQYITIRAARILQDRVVGSTTHHQFTRNDESYAWTSLIEYEGWTADHSIFDNADTFNAVRRGSPIDRVS